MKNAITWFEIPAIDLDRSVKFYSNILGYKIEIDTSMGMPMGLFPYERMGGVGGAIMSTPNIKPSQDGTAVYLFVGDNLDDVLSRVEKSGGIIILPKMQVSPDIGFIAQIVDTEGSRVGLHGMK